ncbi:winged helix-turn-helix domain-containing protein [Pseudoalteromonas sp. SR43-6]|uniref:winged helix-turn-helix domain-containing protein n=1 Tax=unclassified Pseudoalteromonas TaxID=194690 RepID=UPI0015FC50F3|nr:MULTISPECIES: winged helix-turn-helix domain-containing protein [unclassified Pseudoalteromonas]MBB1290092.1 winged helix-turn-helix domain-containing protein [Pseudoalteromonas sp. SR41-5]MBB1373741.1 winged helix-turn-helix domain-containing protein [Pseudoalteromonas sp. SR43-6]MBB1412792.1 winged helix-turn-helix domain-containing protein [Pseudoalteromonas sp. SG43-8]
MNYQIGPWQFISNRCVITSNHLERELDPLLVKLLLHFIDKPQQIVSRQELIESVWQQSFVDDNAINRAISELRKQLAHPIEKAPLLKTHYRKGYSLTVIPERLTQANVLKEPVNILPDSPGISAKNEEIATATTSQPVQKKNSKNFLIYSLLVIICLCSLVWFGLFFINASSSEKIKQITVNKVASTWNIGSEVHPEMSSDKQYLAYTNVEPENDIMHAFVKRLSDQREVEITYPGFQVSILSWQLNQHAVLIQATNLKQQQCEMVLVDLSQFPIVGEATLIKKCDLRYTGYAQVDENSEYIYYTEYKNEQDGSGLYKFDLELLKESIVIPPPGVMYGVIMPRLSSSGNKIAYILSQKGQPFSVFSYDFSTRETKRLFKANKSIISFAFDWLADDKGVIVFEDSDLSTIVFDENNIIKRTLTVTPAISPYYIAVQSANSLFYSANKTQAFSLIKATNLFSDVPEYEALYKSDEDDYHIVEVINEKGPAHIFVSERSGSSQLWLSQNGLTKQLSNFTYEGKSTFAIGGLRVSSKQDRVLLRVNSDIAFFDVMSNKLYTIAEFKGRKILNYVWSKDNESIIYLERSGSENLFAQFNLLTRDTTILEDVKANKLISGADGTNYAITNNQLIKLSNKQSWELPKDARQAQLFAINDNYLYYSDAISRVARLNLEDKTVKDVHVDFKPIAFFISDNNQIFFTESKYKDMQIIQISWNN